MHTFAEKPSAAVDRHTMSNPVPDAANPPFTWNEASNKALQDLIARYGLYASQPVFEAELFKTFSPPPSNGQVKNKLWRLRGKDRRDADEQKAWIAKEAVRHKRNREETPAERTERTAAQQRAAEEQRAVAALCKVAAAVVAAAEAATAKAAATEATAVAYRRRKLDEVQRMQQAELRAQEAAAAVAAAVAAAAAAAAEGTRLVRAGNLTACQQLLEKEHQLSCSSWHSSYYHVVHAITTGLYAHLETHPEAEEHAELFQRLLASHAEVPEEELARRVNERLALVPELLLTDECGTDDWLMRGELRVKGQALLKEREWAAKEAFLLSLVSANNPVTRATAAVVAEILSQKPTAEMVDYAHLKEGKAAFLQLASHHSPEHADLYIALFTLVDCFDSYTRAITQLEVYTRRQVTEGELTALLDGTSVSTLGARAAGTETFLPCSPWYDRPFGQSAATPVGSTMLTACVSSYRHPAELSEVGGGGGDDVEVDQAEAEGGEAEVEGGPSRGRRRGSAVTSLSLHSGSLAMRGLQGEDSCPTASTDFWVRGMLQETSMPPHEYVQLLHHCVGPHLGFPRTLQLMTGPTEVHTEVCSVGARFTSIGEQLVLQDVLMLMGRELVAEQAEGGEDGDLGKMARALKDRPLHFIQQLQHAVSDSRSYVQSAKRLAQMRHTVELGVQLDGDAHLELFDWMRSAVALAR